MAHATAGQRSPTSGASLCLSGTDLVADFAWLVRPLSSVKRPSTSATEFTQSAAYPSSPGLNGG